MKNAPVFDDSLLGSHTRRKADEGLFNQHKDFITKFAFLTKGKEILLSGYEKMGVPADLYCALLRELTQRNMVLFDKDTLTFPEGIKEVSSVFLSLEDSFRVNKIGIPDGVLSLESSCFQGYNFLSEVVLPDSLEEIPKYCFYCCTHLSTIKMPRNLKRIGAFAFSSCAISQVEIPRGTEELGVGCFSRNSLKEIFIPDSVKVVKEDAFANCTDLQTVKFEGSSLDMSVASSAFRACPNVEVIFNFSES